MKNKYLIRFLAAIVFLFISLAIIVSAKSAVFPLQSGSIKSISWDAPEGVVAGYEYYFLQMESGRIFGRGQVVAPQTTVRFRTVGTYSVWVRARNDAGEWGPWAQSTDPAFGSVSGAPAPWLIKVNP